ncbi:Tuberous sclerosis 2-like protein [Neophaeococcomyces mojaviensis]|uniref:Tuberous sclerosis 2-like protein n=1 Tax=Neophaeococcomyces mojaviensis TaxID=3383035 RepID=A0ACC3ABR2_9EURO|nr:Tuberous sclerosis 2-like protein [Knufia sp. JES_112]
MAVSPRASAMLRSTTPKAMDQEHPDSNNVLETKRSQESEAGFVPPGVVVSQAQLHEPSSQGIKAWLTGFGHIKPETNVSTRFRIGEADYPANEPYSLVPLLTRWLLVWFEKSLDEPHDRQQLMWLLKYTADYVGLGHWKLDHAETLELCLALLHICTNARQQNHIEGSLEVFEAVAKTDSFPRECLGDALSTFSSTVVLLESPSPRSENCVKLLASGILSKDTIAILEAQLLIATETPKSQQTEKSLQEDLTKALIPARGATRHLVALIEIVDASEKFVIDFAQLFTVLKQAGEAQLLRLATEILGLCTKILQSPRVNEIVSDQSLICSLLEIYDLCETAYIIPDTGQHANNKQQNAKEDVPKRERRYKKDHASSLATLKSGFVLLLPVVDDDHAANLWDRIRRGDSSMPDFINTATTSREMLIDYAEKKQICLPGKNSRWAEELNYLLENIVINFTDQTDVQLEDQVSRRESMYTIRSSIVHEEDLRIQQRIRALRLCAKGLFEAPVVAHQESQFLPQGQEALKKLFHGMFPRERNNTVRHAFFDELVKLCCESRTKLGTYPYAEYIIRTLQENIVQHAPSNNTADGIYFAGTEAIRSIFLQATALASNVASQAYQALLNIASLACKSQRARLAAMSVLFRIRCDTSGLIYVQKAADSAYLASAVCKTDDSLGAMFADAIDDPGNHEYATTRLQEAINRQLWIYPKEAEYVASWNAPELSPTQVRTSIHSKSDQGLQMSDWLYRIATNLQEDKDWETYSYIIVHLSNQLRDIKLFEGCHQLVVILRSFLCGRVRDFDKMFDPPQDVGLKKVDVALCFYDILTHLIPYSKMQQTHGEAGHFGNDLVRAFRFGVLGKYEGTARGCIHALSLCCFETPAAIASEYPGIVYDMSRTIHRPYLLVHILEFLAQVARLPQLHSNFNKTEIRQIFGICVNALKTLEDKQENKGNVVIHPPRSSTPARESGALKKCTPYRAAMLQEKGIPEYSAALAYHTMIFWFLSIPIIDRRTYVNEITNLLVREDPSGQTRVPEQMKVFVDMMQRSAFSDLPETARDESFSGEDVNTTSYINGNSVITIETNRITGLSQITKRQAAATAHAIYRPLIQDRPDHYDLSFLRERETDDRVLPSHIFLNMIGSAIPVSLGDQALKLNPNEDYVRRAIAAIDRIPTVDSHGIGVLLAKDGQTSQEEYLSNDTGTHSFDNFLDLLGTRVSLQKPCRFEVHQMQYEIDGKETIAWRDRTNEIVYKISSFMPTVDGDPYQIQKMGLIGNSNVVIVFNQSNQPWTMANFRSEAVSVHIVISPANRASSQESSDDIDHDFYHVEVLTKEEYQNISAAAEKKVVSKATLGPLVRMLALNANIFAATVRSLANGQTEFPSSWRGRFQEIVRLRERTQQRVHDNEDSLARRYDFSRWT